MTFYTLPLSYIEISFNDKSTYLKTPKRNELINYANLIESFIDDIHTRINPSVFVFNVVVLFFILFRNLEKKYEKMKYKSVSAIYRLVLFSSIFKDVN